MFLEHFDTTAITTEDGHIESFVPQENLMMRTLPAEDELARVASQPPVEANALAHQFSLSSDDHSHLTSIDPSASVDFEDIIQANTFQGGDTSLMTDAELDDILFAEEPPQSIVAPVLVSAAEESLQAPRQENDVTFGSSVVSADTETAGHTLPTGEALEFGNHEPTTPTSIQAHQQATGSGDSDFESIPPVPAVFSFPSSQAEFSQPTQFQDDYSGAEVFDFNGEDDFGLVAHHHDTELLQEHHHPYHQELVRARFPSSFVNCLTFLFSFCVLLVERLFPGACCFWFSVSIK